MIRKKSAVMVTSVSLFSIIVCTLHYVCIDYKKLFVLVNRLNFNWRILFAGNVK